MSKNSGNSNREKALALVEDGFVNAHTMLVSCLMCMSEDEVGDMLHCEEYDDEEVDDEEVDDEEVD